jgi:hypothetical protein
MPGHRSISDHLPAFLALVASCSSAGCYKWVPAADSGTTDGDIDDDGDAWPYEHCGHLNQLCCDDPACIPGLVCSMTPEGTRLCLEQCELAACDYGGEDGLCSSIEGIGLCMDAVPGSVGCDVEATGCETEYGVSGNTYCVIDADSSTYCFERCDPIPSTCEEGFACFSLQTGEGSVCAPQI